MFFTADQVRTLTEEKLVEFLDRRIPESTGVIDYKLELSGSKPERANIELLKDVSAFANAEGGHLLIGMNEPTEENNGAAFLVGIEAGEQAATQIEQRCAECIDPRIPGLLVRALPLANGKSAVVVHIPPSPSRPHMVIYEGTKTRTFFIRHSETAQPMKSSEVRQAVLSAAAGNQSAIEYAARQEERFKEPLNGRCAFLVHATPLVPVEVLWNVTGVEWRQVIDGAHRQNKRDHINLYGNYRRPSIEGIVALNKDQDPDLIYEVHRTGYVGATLLVSPWTNQTNQKGPYFWGSHSQFFSAFADLCEDAVQTAHSDRPYLLQATITNAATAVLEYERGGGGFISKPLQRNELSFPQLRRDSGQSFLEAVAPWTPIFYNAFGVDYRE